MRLPPPLVALVAGLTQRALARGARRSGPLGTGAAAALAAGSVALAVTAARTFRQAGTTLSPEHPADASVLVTAGPHAVSRNPMYLGLTGLLVANAIRLRSWAALVPLAAFVVVIDRTQIPAEETALVGHFGDDYEAYRSRVPRWVDRRTPDLARRALDRAGRPETTPGGGSAGR